MAEVESRTQVHMCVRAPWSRDRQGEGEEQRPGERTPSCPQLAGPRKGRKRQGGPTPACLAAGHGMHAEQGAAEHGAECPGVQCSHVPRVQAGHGSVQIPNSGATISSHPQLWHICSFQPPGSCTRTRHLQTIPQAHGYSALC